MSSHPWSNGLLLSLISSTQQYICMNVKIQLTHASLCFCCLIPQHVCIHVALSDVSSFCSASIWFQSRWHILDHINRSKSTRFMSAKLKSCLMVVLQGRDHHIGTLEGTTTIGRWGPVHRASCSAGSMHFHGSSSIGALINR